MPLSEFVVEIAFWIGIGLTIVLVVINRRASTNDTASQTRNPEFKGFQRTYLVVYLFAMFADWCQGPYVYALYESYGFSVEDNALLFVCGFGSSAAFGTFIGSMADRSGRRLFALLYCVLYIVSCLTKHVNWFPILMVGRVTGGIATSLLFSVFDSWLICEHIKRGFDEDLLGSTFSNAIFGNSIVAILAGRVSQFAADFKELSSISGNVMYGGYCAPFDVAICFLVICSVMLLALWTENYGAEKSQGATNGKLSASEESPSQLQSFRDAARVLRDQPDVLYCGLVCAFYEASMFIFVFQWSRAVTSSEGPKPPYGRIFACFMVCCMLGSQIFSLLVKFSSVEKIGQLVLLIAIPSHIVPVLVNDPTSSFVAFLLFELTVGIYFPTMGTIKGQLVPEEHRASIYNLYRAPLNIIVCSVLLMKISLTIAFALTSSLLFFAVIVQTRLVHLIQMNKDSNPQSVKAGEIIGLTSPDDEWDDNI